MYVYEMNVTVNGQQESYLIKSNSYDRAVKTIWKNRYSNYGKPSLKNATFANSIFQVVRKYR